MHAPAPRTELLLVFPDGAKRLVPESWTDAVPQEEAGPGTLGAATDLLALSVLISVKPVSTTASKSSRKRTISFAGIASGLTLIFAYLAVAVSAHWFPWQRDIPSIMMSLDSGQLSDASWNSNVVNMIDFLNDHESEVIHLNLTMQSEAGQLFSSKTFNNSNQFLYVKRNASPERQK